MRLKRISSNVIAALLTNVLILVPSHLSWTFFDSQILAQTSEAIQSEADSLLNPCRKHLKEHQFKAALESCQQALNSYHRSQNRLGEAKALNNLGNVYSSLENYVKAIESYQQSLDIAREIKNTELESKAIINLANALAQQGLRQVHDGQFEAAVQPLQEALKIYRQIGERLGEGTALLGLGLAYATGKTGNVSLAIDSLRESLAIAQELGDKNLQDQAQKLLSLLEGKTDSREAEAVRLLKKGMEEYQAGQIEASIQSWQQALAIYRELKNYDAELAVLAGLGSNYIQIGDYRKAIESNQQRLAIARELRNLQQESDALLNLGFGYFSLGDYTKAIEHYQQSLHVANELRDHEREAAILAGLAITYSSLGDFEKAIEYKLRHLAIVRKLRDRQAEQTVLGAIGGSYYYMGDYSKAIEYLQQSLTLARELNDITAEKYSLSDLGVVYDAIGNYSIAINYNNQALALAQKTRNREDQAISLSNLGTNYKALGEYGIAIDYLKQSLAIVREIKSLNVDEPPLNAQQKALTVVRRLVDFEGEATVLNNLGILYKDIGDYRQAIEYFRQSLVIAKGKRDKFSEAVALGNLGNTYRNLQEYSKAVEYYQQYLDNARQIKSRKLKTSILVSFGNLYEQQGKYEKAIDIYQQTLTLLIEIKDRQGEGVILGALGRVYYNQQDYARAMNYFQQSLTVAREIKDRPIEGSALNDIGVSLFRTGNLIEAEKTLMAGIEIWESLQNSLGSRDTERISIFEEQARTYHSLQKVFVAQNKFESALEISERGRTRAFLNLLMRRLTPGAKDEIVASRPSLAVQKFQQIAKEQNATLVEYSRIYEPFRVQGKQQTLESELFIWVIQPTGKVNFRRVDLKSLWQQQNTSLATLVPQSRESIGVTRGSSPTQVTFAPGDRVRLIGDRPNIEPWEVVSVNSQTNTITVHHPTWGDGGTKEIPISEVKSREEISLQKLHQMQKLHQILIEPIADLLPADPNQRVIFIPQGELFLVPFPALQAADGKYLIEKHTILTAPSIQVLDLTRQQRQRVAGSARDILVVGNPSPMPGELRELPYAEKEATEVASLFNTRAITGTQATKAAIIPKLSQARIIHLATHGIFDDIRGLGSAIALAGKNDGFFTAEEISDLNPKLNAELIVLSACDTGRGRITGDGVIGLSRSLISAGVPSVIVSLWRVPDDSTSILMKEFYRQFQRYPDKAQALRQAMLITMKQRPEPKDWAAFTLIGEAE